MVRKEKPYAASCRRKQYTAAQAPYTRRAKHDVPHTAMHTAMQTFGLLAQLHGATQPQFAPHTGENLGQK